METPPEFHRRVTAALAGRPYELVLVDDGSSDGSGELLEQLAARDPALVARWDLPFGVSLLALARSP
jgi:glycosyltransferase involved in cell wall biosynthesis